ncbi:hypothetical protein [Acidovorax sp.]
MISELRAAEFECGLLDNDPDLTGRNSGIPDSLGTKLASKLGRRLLNA